MTQDERTRHQGQSVMLAADAEAAIAAARADMLAKCIAAVEYLHDHEAPRDAHKDALWNAITALRALQKVDTPKQELIEHINLEKP